LDADLEVDFDADFDDGMVAAAVTAKRSR